MRVVVQRVSRASVEWADGGPHRLRNEIGPGVVILVGVGTRDGAPEVEALADKVFGLRIFAADGEGRFDRTIGEVSGEALVISQFTLYADTRKGRRPSFTAAARPALAEPMYEHFVARLQSHGITCRTGAFGRHMEVTLSNDGPVTLVLSTDDWETGIR